MVKLKQVTEKCSWGLHGPICKNEEEQEEDWDGDVQNQPRMCPQNLWNPQPQNSQHPESQNSQNPQPQNTQQSFEIPDRYAEQIHLRKEWEEKLKS